MTEPAAHICTSCGVQVAPSAVAPPRCEICDDERQPRPAPQRWTTGAELVREHANALERREPGLHAIRTEPRFALGQRAYLICTPAGGVLWDCLSLLDEATVERVGALGGIAAIALSHPHFHGAAVDWSAAFGEAPIYVHEADRAWIARPSPSVRLWGGERRALMAGVELVHCGGHFAGSCVLHWAAGAGGGGVLLTSDTIHVCPDGRSVSFMYSYPNLVPLGAAAVQRIRDRALSVAFERIYGAFGPAVDAGAMAVLERSACRYAAFARGERP